MAFIQSPLLEFTYTKQTVPMEINGACFCFLSETSPIFLEGEMTDVEKDFYLGGNIRV